MDYVEVSTILDKGFEFFKPLNPVNIWKRETIPNLKKDDWIDFNIHEIQYDENSERIRITFQGNYLGEVVGWIDFEEEDFQEFIFREILEKIHAACKVFSELCQNN